MDGHDDPTVGEFVADLYASIGDRRRFDAHLDPGITIWESDAAGLLRGLADLDDLRDSRAARRGTATATLAELGPEELVTDVWGGTAVARYILRARYHGDRPDDTFRVTDVMRGGPDGWRIVHHHAEAVTEAPVPRKDEISG